MRVNGIKLYIDIDNTLIDSIQAICDLYNQDFCYYKDFVPVHACEINTYEFKELKCAKHKTIDQYFNQPRFFDQVQFMPYAKEVLDNLKWKYEIILVSMGYSPNLRAKEVWIKENIPYAAFVGCDMKKHKDKSHIDMANSIFIDDSANNLRTSNARYKIVFGDEYPWNKDWEGKRCYNWLDVERILRLLDERGNGR